MKKEKKTTFLILRVEEGFKKTVVLMAGGVGGVSDYVRESILEKMRRDKRPGSNT